MEERYQFETGSIVAAIYGNFRDVPGTVVWKGMSCGRPLYEVEYAGGYRRVYDEAELVEATG